MTSKPTRKCQVSNASTGEMYWHYLFAFIAWLFWVFGPDTYHIEWEIMTFAFAIIGRIERSDLRTRQATK